MASSESQLDEISENSQYRFYVQRHRQLDKIRNAMSYMKEDLNKETETLKKKP